MRAENRRAASALTDRVSIFEYKALVRTENGKSIWTEAFQKALSEHEIIEIPASSEPYYLNGSLRIPSFRHIEAAPGAVIRLTEETKVLLLRNENTLDGTRMPFSGENRNRNISINGGRWEESNERRLGYGQTGKYDEERSYFGVSTCMLFNNIENLTLTNMTFAKTAGFSVQLGNARNVVVENIRFDHCFADGIHVNGNVENVLIRDIAGEVGDDLVALNTYDWQNSSVNFGPGKTILCENVHSDSSSKYKSMRLEPGIYDYADGSSVDCSLTDVVVRKISGILTYKVYFQTPAYPLGTDPERGDAGSVDHLYFEDIDIDLLGPVDGKFDEYKYSDPVRGWFGAFELGSNINYISFENIRLKTHPDEYPLSRMIVVGPKSVYRAPDKEVFDPYITNTVECISLKNITVNGERVTDAEKLIRVTVFDDVNGDGRSSGRGSVKTVIVE